MDLTFSAEDERFRAELRAWLDEHLPAPMRHAAHWTAMGPDDAFARKREWERSKAEAGFAGIEWPEAYGGRGGTASTAAVYDEEMVRANAPSTVNTLGLAYLAPTVMAIGTEQQKRDIIRPMLLCETIWCQGFSEPGAGSDLAALRTRAEPQGDGWLLNGQKTWTSNAKYGDKLFTLARTRPYDETSRHSGISMLLVDMHQAGVDVRPLTQLTGSVDFGEVFFTDAVVPQTEVLGAEGDGWRVAMLLLSFERGLVPLGLYGEFRRMYDEVVAVAKQLGRDTDPVVRQRLAGALVEVECLKYHAWHVLTEVEQGRDLGFGASLTKLAWTDAFRAVSDAYEDVVGVGFQVPDVGGAALGQLTHHALWSRATTIYGGSQQVQRNVVAERVLGLPR
jgi:alkylation response protein AidB-like acyl-CoA dehydrogenase